MRDIELLSATPSLPPCLVSVNPSLQGSNGVLGHHQSFFMRREILCLGLFSRCVSSQVSVSKGSFVFDCCADYFLPYSLLQKLLRRYPVRGFLMFSLVSLSFFASFFEHIHFHTLLLTCQVPSKTGIS